MDKVSLREHLEVTQKASSEKSNLLLAISVAVAAFVWIEIERRLANLNHAHEKAVEVQHTYVGTDIYIQDKQAKDEKIDNLIEEQARLRTARATTIAVVSIASIVLGIIVLFANGKLG